MNKLLTSHEQVPTLTIIRLETGKTTIPGVWCRVYGVGCRFPTSVRIRLSQPPAGDWLAGAWAELGKNKFLVPVKIRTLHICDVKFVT